MGKIILILFFYFCLVAGGAWCSIFLPADLKFGAGSSAFQIEGGSNLDGRTPSILDTISEQNDWNVGDACKSYELYKRDVEIAKEMGLQFYRFSIPWTRILPKGFADEVNEAGVKHYNDFIDELLANGIEPAVTILHGDIPESLYDYGDWNKPDFKDWFGDYARILFSLFGDRVKTWFTINEPIIFCYEVAPLGSSQFDSSLCAKNMLLAHAKAWRIYDEEFRKTQNGVVSLVNHILWLESATKDDEKLTELVRQYSLGIFSQPIYSSEGGWPESVEEALAMNINATKLSPLSNEEVKMIQGTYDFYAVNYYTSKLVRKPKFGEEIGEWPLYGSPDLGAVFYDSPDWQKTSGSDWITVVPEGIRKTLQWLNKKYGVKKFFITENGFPSADTGLDDVDRIKWIRKHLEKLSLAVNEDGLQVLGYSAWSLMDSFEFASTYTVKFGLYSVNFTDPLRERTPRSSAHFYRSLIHNATNRLPVQ